MSKSSLPFNPSGIRTRSSMDPSPPSVDMITRPAQDPVAARLDVERILKEAEREGLLEASAARIREKMAAFPPDDMTRLANLEAQLRRWIREHRG